MTTTEDVEARDIAGGVRDLLRGTGARAESKWVRGLREGRESNVLFGVALHAAERRVQGRTLNNLERDLLDALGSILTDEELAAAGAEYRAALSDLGEIQVLPRVVTDMPVSEGFTVEDLMAHMPTIRAQNAKRANCAVVDIAEVAAGAPFDSPEFEAAVGDVGSGISVVVGPPVEDGVDTGPDYPPYNVKLLFENFTCRRVVGDQGTTRDEIYWSAGARSDLHVHPAYKSQEFGEIRTDDTRSFTSDNKVVFDGSASQFVAMTVMVWEADQSPSQFYEALLRFIDEWLDKPIWMEITLGIIAAFPGGGTVGAIMDGMDVAFTIVRDLQEAFRNHDDLSCQRTYFFDRNALVTMYNQPNLAWDYNGDGRHTLRVKYAGERPVFPSGVLKYLTVNESASGWNAPVSMGWRSASPASLASFGGKLHCMYVRPAKQQEDRWVMWSTMTDGIWTKPVRVNRWASDYAPGLAAFKGKLYAAVVALNGDLVLSSYSGSGDWSGTQSILNVKTKMAASLAASDDRLFASYHQYWDGPWDQPEGFQLSFKFDGSTWVPVSAWPAVTPTDHRISSTVRNDVYWSAHRNRDHGSNTVSWIKGLVSDYEPLPSGWRTEEGPTITTHDGKIWLVARGLEGHLHCVSGTGNGWTLHPDADFVNAMEGEPALASHNGKLYVMYR
ncbi:hypothetical protein [Streptomyces sp. NPDC054865]